MDSSIPVSYKNLEQASEHILKLLGEFIGVNTLFIAVNDGQTNFILKALNRSEVLVQEGSSVPFLETYCGLVARHADDVLVIEDTESSPLTCDMDVTQTLGSTAFVGVPILLQDKTVCGTICALDQHGHVFSERELDLLKTMAQFLAYVVDLEAVAFHDELTNAFNRNFINLFLTETWKDKFNTVAFVFLDIDDFKEVNDTYGHSVGDEVLAAVVTRIEQHLTPEDMVCRVGGDEFVAVMPNFKSTEFLLETVQNMLDEFASPVVTEEADVFVSLSIGISVYPEDGHEIDELLENADQAMYRVKNTGKRNFQLFSGDREIL